MATQVRLNGSPADTIMSMGGVMIVISGREGREGRGGEGREGRREGGGG